VVRARLDEVVSYDGATGHVNWTFALPGQDVMCTMSAGTADHVGFIGYAAPNAPCTHIVALDLATGRTLWATTATGQEGGTQVDVVTASAGTAAVVASDAVVGYSARSGKRTWSTPAASGCEVLQITAGGDQIAELANCADGLQATALDAATGKVRWRAQVAEQGANNVVGVISANPVTVNVLATEGRRTNTIQAFTNTGHVQSTITGSEVQTKDGPVVLDTALHVFDAAPLWWTFVDKGLLVGVTQQTGGHTDVVGIRLSDGKQQWVTQLPDDVLAVRDDAGTLLVVDDDQPTPVLDSISVVDGSTTVVGIVPGGAFGGETGMYRSGPGFALVNSTGTNPTAPVSVVGR
jgi:outer membrane protein assembly factor BamB